MSLRQQKLCSKRTYSSAYITSPLLIGTLTLLYDLNMENFDKSLFLCVDRERVSGENSGSSLLFRSQSSKTELAILSVDVSTTIESLAHR